MSKQKKPAGIRPKIEVLIILVFFFSFILWAASKCNTTAVPEEIAEPIGEEDNETTDSTAIADNPYGKVLPPANPTPGTPSGTNGQSTPLSVPNPSEAFSKLYITIDGLNMRTGPHLDSTILYKLSLFEEVWFLNEVTDSTQRISLGAEIADEPWVKIKHKKGRVGWVYGAGVNYYRKARLPRE